MRVQFTQIGEFAFIIASLGVSLHVTSDFLYPIVVAVSVITTFLTPYMIRLAGPASDFADRHLPESWKSFLARYSSGPQTVNHENLVAETSFRHARIVVVYSIVSISIVAISFRLVVPVFRENLPAFLGLVVRSCIYHSLYIAFSPVPSWSKRIIRRSLLHYGMPIVPTVHHWFQRLCSVC